jgi:hypothetical protein
MPDRTSGRDRTAREFPEWDLRQAGEETAEPAGTRLGYLPTSAWQFHIVILQQWIDLCA